MHWMAVSVSGMALHRHGGWGGPEGWGPHQLEGLDFWMALALVLLGPRIVEFLNPQLTNGTSLKKLTNGTLYFASLY